MNSKLGVCIDNLNRAKDLLVYWKTKKRSLEAYACRIDPYEDEVLSMVVQDILDARDEIDRLQFYIYRAESERAISILLKGRSQ